MASKSMMETIERRESEVRSYVRSFPVVFSEAQGAKLKDTSGKEYIDFFAGAGTLNYGHNDPHLKEAMLQYLASDGVVHGLDMATEAKVAFLESFENHILSPRALDYKVMFPGPTGTNAVETALKLARKVTGRTEVIAFTNAFHGMTLGSLALTGNQSKRAGGGLPLGHVSRMPFDGYMGGQGAELSYLEKLLDDPSSGLDAPAAIIVESVQGEGGVNAGSKAWLEGLSRVAQKHGALFIVDDIQVGCGRTGPFFSFERFDFTPDIVCLSKSISGYGLPMALTLFKPELDQWGPGEHNGTFRGNNLAFVTAKAALEKYWADDSLAKTTELKAALIRERIVGWCRFYGGQARGRGMIQGIALSDPAKTAAATRYAFEQGVLIETSGPKDEVLKFLSPLTIGTPELRMGLDIVDRALARAFEKPTDLKNGRRKVSDAQAQEVQL